VHVKSFSATARSKLKRLPKRGHYDRDTVYAVLDAGFVCHVGYAIDAQPYVTPTCYWREGDALYWHGSAASRMLRHLEKGVECCLTVTHVDALVLARSGFHHSINYRSAMIFGRAHKIEDPQDKLARMEAFIERMFPGRWQGLRPVTRQELKGTTVLGMAIGEASAKIRSGPPVDDDADYALPIWAGLVPVRQVAGAPADDGRLAAGAEVPRNLSDLAHIGLARR
jgi:nitroimidazol reductase NimA-like FMN-containing flavoprotein (pyridoxamine 5'-phosphate oxidase superfamily)